MRQIVKVYQPNPEKLQELYGDPRGSFDGLEERRKWYPAQFEGKGKAARLKMDFYSIAFDLDVEGYVYFYDLRKMIEKSELMKACEEMFRLCNHPMELESMVKHFGYKGYSMSVGNVVEFRFSKDDSRFFYCDSVGFVEINPVLVPLGFAVGDGATRHGYSDRYPYHISRISPSGKTVWIKSANWEVVPKEGGYQRGDDVKYTFTPNPDAPEEKCVQRNDGRWYCGGALVTLGSIDKYEDPHF